MDAKDYLLPLDELNIPNECVICLYHEEEDIDKWMLGDVFLRGWYSTYDYKNKKMGFAPHATSTKDPIVKANGIPEEFLPKDSTSTMLIIVIIIVVVVVALSVTFIVLALDGKLG